MLPRLQKVDKDTNELIDRVKNYLFSIGIRTSRERAWEVFRAIHHMPYELLIEKNPKIKYQGAGQHISHKHGNMLLSIKNVGKFKLQGVSTKQGKKKKAAIKFEPSNEMKNLIEKIEVVEDINV